MNIMLWKCCLSVVIGALRDNTAIVITLGDFLSDSKSASKTKTFLRPEFLKIMLTVACFSNFSGYILWIFFNIKSEFWSKLQGRLLCLDLLFQLIRD